MTASEASTDNASGGHTAAFIMSYFGYERIFHGQERYLQAACMANAGFFGYNISENAGQTARKPRCTI